MGFLSFRRQPRVATLHDELRRLEERARSACTDSGDAFSRSLLARESGVSESTLAAWFDRGRIPQESGKLMDVVQVLSSWADCTLTDVQWQELWITARKNAAARKGSKDASDGTAEKVKSWARRGLGFAATTAVVALISGLFYAFGGDIHSHLPLVGGRAAAAPQSAAVEDFDAQANWCCKLISVEASTGFYWPGTPSSFFAALHPGQGSTNPVSLTPAGLGLIEIPVQTSGTEPILVAPPKIIVRSRQRNLTRGLIAILPRGGQGIGSTGQFEADVDNAKPVTVPFGTTGSQSSS